MSEYRATVFENGSYRRIAVEPSPEFNHELAKTALYDIFSNPTSPSTQAAAAEDGMDAEIWVANFVERQRSEDV